MVSEMIRFNNAIDLLAYLELHKDRYNLTRDSYYDYTTESGALGGIKQYLYDKCVFKICLVLSFREDHVSKIFNLFRISRSVNKNINYNKLYDCYEKRYLIYDIGWGQYLIFENSEFDRKQINERFIYIVPIHGAWRQRNQ